MGFDYTDPRGISHLARYFLHDGTPFGFTIGNHLIEDFTSRGTRYAHRGRVNSDSGFHKKKVGNRLPIHSIDSTVMRILVARLWFVNVFFQ
jgi:hypothetical protein